MPNTPTKEEMEMARRFNGMDLAVWLHLQYEDAAARLGWKTQENCRVAFSDLPRENRMTMEKVAELLSGQIAQLLHDSNEKARQEGRDEMVEVVAEQNERNYSSMLEVVRKAAKQE